MMNGNLVPTVSVGTPLLDALRVLEITGLIHNRLTPLRRRRRENCVRHGDRGNEELLNASSPLILISLLLFTLAVTTIAPFFGRSWIPVSALWAAGGDQTVSEILWEFRIPRAAMAFLAGTAWLPAA